MMKTTKMMFNTDYTFLAATTGCTDFGKTANEGHQPQSEEDGYR